LKTQLSHTVQDCTATNQLMFSKTTRAQQFLCDTQGWSAWLRGRTSVSGQRSFAALRSTCSWWV